MVSIHDTTSYSLSIIDVYERIYYLFCKLMFIVYTCIPIWFIQMKLRYSIYLSELSMNEIKSRLMRFTMFCPRVSQVCTFSFTSSTLQLPRSPPPLLSLIGALKIEIVLIWDCKLANGKTKKQKKNATINQLPQWEGILGAWAALPIGHWQALKPDRRQAGVAVEEEVQRSSLSQKLH